MSKIKNSLSENEYKLILATETDRLTDLSEGKLLKLHRRTRRARNKAVQQYRRAGAQKVSKKGGRGLAKKVNVRRAERAELFEEALSRVSYQLGVVAHQSAKELKAERLAAAKKDSPAPRLAADGDGKVASKGKARVDKTRQSSGRKKYEASSIAQGAKRQAKRDNR
ncbi:hypothetical protein HH308_25560 [Gordonia sp. TBRC 11910]|uniref:Uncharacterized protein n=1 Tax=Gordonia asplenii TaxID=2725283 RepID=A0A848L7A3_9ACTN|nr:hypothetical protein [Gordonia asplenii]NMO04593.1 hypothetical protein [Gordonia asplenii]